MKASLILSLLLPCWVSGQDTGKKLPPGLEVRVTLKVEPGPVLPALDAVEAQTRVSFSVLPELLPPDLKAQSLSHVGSLKDGLDKLARSLGLRWEVGEFGGIVLVPTGFKMPSHADWVTANFSTTGVEAVVLSEAGQRLGLKEGDVVVALNGEKILSEADFFQVFREVKSGEEYSLSIRRGAESLQFKYVKGSRFPINAFHESPSILEKYRKAGHHDPKWDAAFERMCGEVRKEPRARDPAKVLSAARECAKAGCRDPYLAELVAEHAPEYGVARFEELEGWSDPARLRSDYGGTRLLSGPAWTALFAAQGNARVREVCRKRLEAAWTLLQQMGRSDPHRHAGFALANLRFLRGEYEDCARLMVAVRDYYLAQSLKRESKLHLQALARIGRWDEVFKQFEAYTGNDRAGWDQTLLSLLTNTRAGLEAEPDLANDRFPGPAGLVGWKCRSAIEGINRRVKGQLSARDLPYFDVGGFAYSTFRLEPLRPFPETAEVHFFTQVHRAYDRSTSRTGVVFGAIVEGDEKKGITKTERYSGVQYNVTGDLRLWRWHADTKSTIPIPLPGFANDGNDDLVVTRTARAATVRANGIWITTDVTGAFAVRGDCLLDVFGAQGRIDSGVFLPTQRCYDNDEIRRILERISDPAEKMTAEEALGLWDQAASLAPPENFMKGLRAWWVDRGLTAKIPPPSYPADAPALEPLGHAGARARLEKRGPCRWIHPDPEDKDLLWCARPDGTLESMNLVRYWTTRHPYLRELSGRDLVVGDPVFRKDGIWFPTDRGLFRYDRRGGMFKRLPLGDVLHELPIKQLTAGDPNLKVETMGGEKWAYDAKKGSWSR